MPKVTQELIEQQNDLIEHRFRVAQEDLVTAHLLL